MNFNYFSQIVIFSFRFVWNNSVFLHSQISFFLWILWIISVDNTSYFIRKNLHCKAVDYSWKGTWTNLKFNHIIIILRSILIFLYTIYLHGMFWYDNYLKCRWHRIYFLLLLFNLKFLDILSCNVILSK